MGEFKKLGIEQARLPDNQCYRWEEKKDSKDKGRPQVHSLEMEITYYSISEVKATGH